MCPQSRFLLSTELHIMKSHLWAAVCECLDVRLETLGARHQPQNATTLEVWLQVCRGFLIQLCLQWSARDRADVSGLPLSHAGCALQQQC